MKLRGPFDYAQVRMTHLLKKSDMSSLETFPRRLKPQCSNGSYGATKVAPFQSRDFSAASEAMHQVTMMWMRKISAKRMLKARTRPPQRQNATADPCGMTTKEQTTKSEGAALVGQKSRWRSRFLHYAAHKGVSSFGRNDKVFYVRGKNMLVALRCRNDKVFYV